MKTRPIVAAAVELAADGTPRSPRFDDVYRPAGDGTAQARRVFLAGNGLPARWRGRDRFVVLEAGFGLGHNFLALWRAWHDDAARPGRLHVVAIDVEPPARATVAALPREAGVAELAARLVAAWPPLVPSLHRLAFDDDRVELLLAFGDVADWLPQVVARVDAFFLDGFAPAKNPAMWQPRVFKAMARLAAPGATAATWSAARAVRDGLSAAGFAVRAAAGGGGKRDVTFATWAPAWTPHRPPGTAGFSAPGPASTATRIAVVGAGLAGSAVAAALARHGLRCTVLDREPHVAAGASGNAVGIFHAVVHGDDARHARWHRAAALAAAAEVRALVAAAGPQAGAVDGVLRVAGADRPAQAALARMRADAAALGLPVEHAVAVDAEEASRLAGTRIAMPAWRFGSGGWVDPAALVGHRFATAAAAGSEVRVGREIAALRRDGACWSLLDREGRVVAEVDVVVCCNAADAPALIDTAGASDASAWPITRVRGQVSAIDLASSASTPASSARSASASTPTSAPHLPVAGAGFAAASGGRLWFGATAQAGDGDGRSRPEDDAANLSRVSLLLPDLVQGPRDLPSSDSSDLSDRPPSWPPVVASRVSWRCVSADRLPIVGAVPDARRDSPRPEQPRFAPRQEGLYVLAALGSRGIASSALGGAIVAAQIAGAPLPAEADLLDAVDPARFASRRARRSP